MKLCHKETLNTSVKTQQVVKKNKKNSSYIQK